MEEELGQRCSLPPYHSPYLRKKNPDEKWFWMIVQNSQKLFIDVLHARHYNINYFP
jgi:hypothetical protein